jgi:hypothetical protein
MRIHVPLVIEMTGEQLAAYASEYGLPRHGGRLTAKEVVDDVQGYVLTCVQESAAFCEIGDSEGTRGADVSIKRR